MEGQDSHGGRLRRAVGCFQGLRLSGAFLLDTSVVIWTFEENERISSRAKRALLAPSQPFFVSVVSLWEIILKAQSGKLTLSFGLRTAIDDILSESSWSVLSLQTDALNALINLPFLHRDPFDRILIAQAQSDGLTIVTPDSQIRRYDVPTLW